jgi:DNA-binding MarR family transcriptional regulator
LSTVDAGEVSLWLAWKRVSESSRGRILSEVIANSPLNEPELTVLALLDEAGGKLRQNALATAAGWDRTRLSHLLSRMEERGYLSRQRLQNGVEVNLLPAGDDVLLATKGPLAGAVHRYFASRLSVEQRSALRHIVDALSD